MRFRRSRQDRNQSHRAGAILLSGVMLLLGTLAGRLMAIHLGDGPRLRSLAERQQTSQSVIPARRGMIMDVRGRTVALSRQVPDVFVDPALTDDIASLAARLAVRVNRPVQEILSRVRQRPGSRYVVVARAVDSITAEAVRALDDPAVGLTYRGQRFYPLRESLAHVLGWVGFDGVGLGGIELAHDDHLRGRDGRRTTIRDVRRRAIRPGADGFVPPIDGGHVVLTIDAEIQRIVEEALTSGVRRFEAQSGVTIVLSPDTGEVLAMACTPSFDPNQPLEDDPSLRRNRCVTDPVEPGSTFKAIIAAAALDGGYVTPFEKIDCHMGRHRFESGRVLTDTKPHGMMDIRGIITRSSNIGMGIIAERMGNEVLYEAVRRFGFGERTGVGCPGEGSGVVHALKHWNSYSTTSIPIGYEVLVTPIQLATAFAAMVNNGVRIKPRIVKALLSPEGDVVQAFDTLAVVGRVVSAETARFVTRDLLVSVVENGGGHRARTGPYRVLGKTGTAKLTFPDRRGYEPDAYLSVFVGAAPVYDPRIVCVTMIRRPNRRIGYYGGQVAGPVVGEIITQTLTYMQVPPEEPVASRGL